MGTERAVASLGRADGYFGNAAVKILMPSSLQKVAEVARMAGYQKQVDEFILNIFGDAIRAMSFDDVHGILTGGDTAATDFFRRKTSDKLYAAFKPVVAKKVDEVGATKAYKSMIGQYDAVPMVSKKSLDLDHYVTDKALAGLFHMLDPHQPGGAQHRSAEVGVRQVVGCGASAAAASASCAATGAPPTCRP